VSNGNPAEVGRFISGVGTDVMLGSAGILPAAGGILPGVLHRIVFYE
jgi:hypothetical protein